MSELPRLSPIERQIMSLLIGRGEMYGLQMVDASEGAIGRGTIYVTLNRMEDKGLIQSRTEPLPPGATCLPRRMYKPTGQGERALAAWELAESHFALGVL